MEIGCDREIIYQSSIFLHPTLTVAQLKGEEKTAMTVSRKLPPHEISYMLSNRPFVSISSP